MNYYSNLILDGKVIGRRFYIGYDISDMGVFDVGLDWSEKFGSLVETYGDSLQYVEDIQCYLNNGYLESKKDTDKVVWGINSEAIYKYAINRYVYPIFDLSRRDMQEIALDRVAYYKDVLRDKYSMEVLPIVKVTIKPTYSTWGSCRNSRVDCHLDFAEVLMFCGSQKGIDTVVFHELTHACKGHHGHKGAWKEHAQYFSKYLPFDVTRTNSANDLGISPVLLPLLDCCICQCKGCDNAFVRKRNSKAVKNIVNYRCGVCGESFEVLY